MKDGYYWARWMKEDEWKIVRIRLDFVDSFDYEYSCAVKAGLWEFGDRIEIPEKYA